MKILCESEQNRVDEYYLYLDDHIKGVQDAWTHQLRPIIVEKYSDKVDVEKVDDLVRNHDRSKYLQEEFDAYLHYFYPTSEHPKDEDAFNAAWLLHIHKNPHHHQYWVLIRDEGELLPIDMPIEYICEMLCDWSSFSRKNPSSTAYVWYENNAHKMNLSSNTKEWIETLREYLKDPLESDYE